MGKHKITEFPYINIIIRAYNTKGKEWPDSGGNKEGLLTFVCFSTDVMEGEESIGFIGGGIGSVVVSSKGDDYFQIKHDDLWNAVQKAKGEMI